uniref:HAT C-terminal dimerisation domain-containing protein n=1 Tax=Sphaeramia orbicularis TaxID=375764 RepID=A0A673CRU7_9TELE
MDKPGRRHTSRQTRNRQSRWSMGKTGHNRQAGSKNADSSQPQISQFITSNKQHYSTSHPQQNAITRSILLDLVIDCNLPLSIIEHPSFRRFMSVVDTRYNPVSRRTLTSKLDGVVPEKPAKLKNSLANAENVSVTVDIWSDRKMRGFLGVAAHWLDNGEGGIVLKSALLACNRFSGSHTGERICEEFEQICEEYQIKRKLLHIIRDNAANMRKAFSTSFPQHGDQEDDEDEGVEDDNLWTDLPVEDQERVDLFLQAKSQTRQQCFAHTLQLVVGDGLKDTKIANAALAKACKLSNLLHSSTSFKDIFEREFGQSGIPSSVVTRWNSTLRQLKAVLKCDATKLTAILQESGHKETAFTLREWSQIQELVRVLEPFAEATDLTQGEKVVTISAVVPCVLSLNHHLENLKENSSSDCQPLPFSDPLYLKAAMLDPSFGSMWVMHDVLVPDNTKEEVLFASYQNKRQKKDSASTPHMQLTHFLDICSGQDCLHLWTLNRHTLPSVFKVVVRLLHIPASSAPVERVFSHGGVIMRPHRSQLSAKVLTSLIFCKCNGHW